MLTFRAGHEDDDDVARKMMPMPADAMLYGARDSARDAAYAARDCDFPFTRLSSKASIRKHFRTP